MRKIEFKKIESLFNDGASVAKEAESERNSVKFFAAARNFAMAGLELVGFQPSALPNPNLAQLSFALWIMSAICSLRGGDMASAKFAMSRAQAANPANEDFDAAIEMEDYVNAINNTEKDVDLSAPLPSVARDISAAASRFGKIVQRQALKTPFIDFEEYPPTPDMFAVRIAKMKAEAYGEDGQEPVHVSGCDADKLAQAQADIASLRAALGELNLKIETMGKGAVELKPKNSRPPKLSVEEEE